MKKDANIPKEIKEYMASRIFNSAEFIRERNGVVIYALGLVDEKGLAVPIGMPTLVELSNGKLRLLSTEEAFEVLDSVR